MELSALIGVRQRFIALATSSVRYFYHIESRTHIHYCEALNHLGLRGVGSMPNESFSAYEQKVIESAEKTPEHVLKTWIETIELKPQGTPQFVTDVASDERAIMSAQPPRVHSALLEVQLLNGSSLFFNINHEHVVETIMQTDPDCVSHTHILMGNEFKTVQKLFAGLLRPIIERICSLNAVDPTEQPTKAQLDQVLDEIKSAKYALHANPNMSQDQLFQCCANAFQILELAEIQCHQSFRDAVHQSVSGDNSGKN